MHFSSFERRTDTDYVRADTCENKTKTSVHVLVQDVPSLTLLMRTDNAYADV